MNLQEVSNWLARRNNSLVIRNSVEDLEISLQVGVESKNRGNIATSVAVVRSGPNSYELFVEHVFVSFLYELMGPGHQLQAVELDEFFGWPGTE